MFRHSEKALNIKCKALLGSKILPSGRFYKQAWLLFLISLEYNYQA